MDQRSLEKERIRLTREITMLEAQFSAAVKGKEEKLDENKQIREEIARLEEENKSLEEETRKLDDEIAGLDNEFKQAQLDAGRLRREIKVNNERAETEQKLGVELRGEINKLESALESLRREIKNEIDERRSLESKLRKTNAHIDSMKSHALAKLVTKRLEKQEWYRRIGDTELPASDGEDVEDSVQPMMTATEEPEPLMDISKEPEKKQDEGVDFSLD